MYVSLGKTKWCSDAVGLNGNPMVDRDADGV
jgi:hypothetical protein